MTTSQQFHSGSEASPGFVVDFGTRVVQMDPTKLFNISGTNRTDVALDVNAGRVYITAYVLNSTAPSTIT